MLSGLQALDGIIAMKAAAASMLTSKTPEKSTLECAASLPA